MQFAIFAFKLAKMNAPGNKVIVITGGSSGIGYATADALLSRKAIVCLIARNQEKLNEARATLLQKYPDAFVSVYPCDITNHDQVKHTVAAIAETHGAIDWLINNAGMGETGRFESQPVEVMQLVMDTNYWGPVYMTLEALPWLKKSKGAAIAFVSSVAGYVGLFGYTHYVPSKFALTGLAECLRMEFKDYNIPVTLIYPPDTKTPMHEKEKETTLPECRALSGNAKVVGPELVAKKLVEGMEKSKFEIYCNGESKLIRVLRGMAPGMLFSQVDGIVEKARKKHNFKS
jgi:3-dehydrosphinganine reductase